MESLNTRTLYLQTDKLINKSWSSFALYIASDTAMDLRKACQVPTLHEATPLICAECGLGLFVMVRKLKDDVAAVFCSSVVSAYEVYEQESVGRKCGHQFSSPGTLHQKA